MEFWLDSTAHQSANRVGSVLMGHFNIIVYTVSGKETVYTTSFTVNNEESTKR